MPFIEYFNCLILHVSHGTLLMQVFQRLSMMLFSLMHMIMASYRSLNSLDGDAVVINH